MDTLIERLNADDMLGRHGAYYTTHISIVGSDKSYHFDINRGRVSARKAEAAGGGFSLVGTSEVWSKYCQDIPPPEHHELGAMLAAGHVNIEGDMQILQSNFMYVRRLLEIWRDNQREQKK